MSMDETNELLRQIWQHMVAMGKALNVKVDGVKEDVAALSTRMDTRVDKLESRMMRNFERIELRLVVLDGRLDDLDERVLRIEEHLGFSAPKPTP